MIIPLLDVIPIKSYQRISPEEYIKRNDERNAHNTFSFKIRNSLRISLPLGRKKDCGSLTMRSFERDNHRNLGDRAERGGPERILGDLRCGQVALRIVGPVNSIRGPKLRDAIYAMDTRPYTRTEQGGRGEGMGIGKLSCRPKLDYGFAVYTHSHTWPHRIIPYSRLTADKIFSLVHPSLYVITSPGHEPPSNFIFFFSPSLFPPLHSDPSPASNEISAIPD